MNAKLTHLAIVSENYALSASFYQSLFGMRTFAQASARRAITVGDGYVGLNINPRKAGRPARLDHFGIQVDDIATALERLHAAIAPPPETAAARPRLVKSQAAPATAPAAASRIRFCPQCGVEAAAGKFCSECGAPLSVSARAAARAER